MKLAEIAEKILVHLRRFAENKSLNTPHTSYWTPSAWAAGSRVGVRYVAYQSDTFIKKSDAEAYLQWLDAGNIGKYWKFDEQRQRVTE